ncbi:MAG: aminotransferase class I/II-fold pyridoxal phosphate-dependent enzyme [Firmicutes bacterium]|nr:aminotransferase class I/II-fold pyridoxal phosphate-dependent enzyme [Bacillota bacterium]
MNKTLQQNTPIVNALNNFREARVVPFDVPGHKRGKGNNALTEFLGKRAVSIDVNGMKPLDYLNNPRGVIKEAETIMADAFSASAAFLLTGGTSAAVQAMIMSSVKKGEKIIISRAVHVSVINALILCGAIPIYINPGVNKDLGIPLGMSIENIEKTMEQNPDAKAILFNNPSYYGVCSDVKNIVRLAKKYKMRVLIDEAHGTHFNFGKDLPISGIKAGADMVAVSMHKSGLSLTQSAVLLCGKGINADYIRKIINLTQTTSGNYLLLASLDISRKELALNGKDLLKKTQELVDYAKEEINDIGDYYAFGKELINGDTVFDFDPTKLSVHTLNMGLAGIEVYDILRDEYNIQVEFGDLGNFLAYVSPVDKMAEIERLVGALEEIRRLEGNAKKDMIDIEYIHPEVSISPQEAFNANRVEIKLEDAVGRVSNEYVLAYPPGIPLLAPGEIITEQIIRHIGYMKAKGCYLMGCEDKKINYLYVVK